jgi:hypothetical protein
MTTPVIDPSPPAIPAYILRERPDRECVVPGWAAVGATVAAQTDPETGTRPAVTPRMPSVCKDS